MTAKEMFKKLGYKQTRNDDYLIDYKNDYGDGDYVYIRFALVLKEYEIGYYDYETKTEIAVLVRFKEHEAITQQMKELGWI